MGEPRSATSSFARLFIGLWPSPGVRVAVRRHAEHWAWPDGAALVPDDKLHMTLHFLGAVPRERLDDLSRALAVPFEPFDIRLVRAALWPGGIAVLCPAGPPPELQSLHARLQRKLCLLEQPPVRPHFKPHVTLARRAFGAVPPAAPADIRWAVDGFALVESEPGPPAAYRVLREYG